MFMATWKGVPPSPGIGGLTNHGFINYLLNGMFLQVRRVSMYASSDAELQLVADPSLHFRVQDQIVPLDLH